MSNLNDLLDLTFGNKQKTPKNSGEEKSRHSHTRGKYFSEGECVNLLIALNYAINAIKNKRDVVEKRENSTRYEYYQRWFELREKIKKT